MEHFPNQERDLPDNKAERGREVAKHIADYMAHVQSHPAEDIEYVIYLTGHEGKTVDTPEGKRMERHVCTMVGGREDLIVPAIIDLIQTIIHKRPEAAALFAVGALDILETLRRDHGESVTDKDGKIVGTAVAFGPGIKNPDADMKEDKKSANTVQDLLKRFFSTPGEDHGSTKH